jgi:uncharacterized protein involved in cysteine biosynthesis
MNINFKNPESKEINVVVNVGNGLVVEAGRKVALYLGSERSFIVVVLIGVVVGIVGLLVPLFGIPVTVQAAVLSVGVSSVGAAEGERLSHRILRG